MSRSLHIAATLLSTAIFCWLICVQTAQSQTSRIARILLVETMPVPVVLEHTRWFIAEMNALGYQNGQNMDLVVLKANGDRLRAENLLTAAIEQKPPDLVVTNATLASQAARQVLQETQIPMVFMTVSDPVGAGIIPKIGVPTGIPVTGRVHMINRQTRINMVMRLIGKTASQIPIRIGFIHSSYPSAVGDLKELQLAVQGRNDIVFISHTVSFRKIPEGLSAMLTDVEAGIALLEERIDYWWEPSGPLGELTEYTRLLLEKSGKPIVMGTKIESVRLGALLHLTPSIEGSGREVGRLADAILKGADPGTIPPLPPSSFDVGVNLKTAVKSGVVVPPDLLNLAGENVF